MDDFDDFVYSYHDESTELYDGSIYEIYKYCVEPTMFEIFPYIWKMILANLFFRIVISTPFIPPVVGNICSFLSGFILLYYTMPNSYQYILIFVIFCYTTYLFLYYILHDLHVYIIGCVYFTYLIGSELFFPNPATWMEVRGLHMIITMKFISLIFDVQNKSLKRMPNIIQTAGYIFSPHSCILGPWVSYKSYHNMFLQNRRKNILFWIVPCLVFLTLSLIFISLSNCWATYFIPQTFKLMSAYQEALSYRSSHYFVCFLSSAMLAIVNSSYDENKNSNGIKSYIITNPYFIEFPRSLVQVVVYWNIPMHTWLKKYVFRMSKPLGNFIAVILTYLVSSFLHGFNLKLAAVLLSLGFYTYVEYEFRKKLSEIFDACIKANNCNNCNHKYKDHYCVYLVNVVFSGLAIFHLAYLGCLMEYLAVNSESDEQIFDKWKDLGYSSHLVTASIYLFHKFV